MSEYIISYIMIVIELISYILFFNIFCNKRKINIKGYEVIIIFGLSIIDFFLYNFNRYFIENIYLKFIYVIIVMSAVMWLIYNVKVYKSVILTILLMAIGVISDYIVLLISMGVYGGLEKNEPEYIIQGTLLAILGKGLYLLCINLIGFFIKCKSSNFLNEKQWIKILVIPSLSIISIITLIDAVGGISNIQLEKSSIIVAIMLVVMNIAIFYIINDILVKDNEIRINQENQLKMKSELDKYNEISKYYEYYRKQNHEYKNRIICIETLLHNKNYDELDIYLKELGEDIRNFPDAIDTGNTIVNVIVNTKLQEAEKNNILFIAKLDNLKYLNLSDDDTVVLFSNLINNAIEAAKESEKRTIKLKISHEHNETIIAIVNTYNGIINDDLKTSKDDSYLHGVGINNIISIVDKYNGIHYIKYNESEFTFIISLPQ